MIRPNTAVDDKSLFNADMDDIFKAKRLIEMSALNIATVVHCCPLDKDIKFLKGLGCDIMEVARRIGAFAVAYQNKWEHGASFIREYTKALTLDDGGEQRFYEEIMPIAKSKLKKMQNGEEA